MQGLPMPAVERRTDGCVPAAAAAATAEEGEGDRQTGGLDGVSSAHCPIRSLAAGTTPVFSSGRLGLAMHSPHRPLSQRKCVWHFFLLSHLAPIWPGCPSVLRVQTLFMQRRDGEQSSAALQRWPGQPNVQARSAGMKGFGGREVRGDKRVEGAER